MKNVCLRPFVVSFALLVASPCPAQDMATPCTALILGAIVFDEASGRHLGCDGRQWVEINVAAPSVSEPAVWPDAAEPPVSAGAWRFNDQTRAMEYFDGSAWVAVMPLVSSGQTLTGPAAAGP